MVGDAGVGDHDVEVLDSVIGLQFGHCGEGIGFRNAVDFHEDDFAAFAGKDSFDSG